jgi:hypothetical protein
MPKKKSVQEYQETFWDRVERTDSCWLWAGSQTSNGYGLYWASQTVLAHRYAYELVGGPIPDALQIDHLCRVRHCVNPDHLEPVTQKENVRRGKTSALRPERLVCRRGHALTPDNVDMVLQHGKRSKRCLACRRRASKEAAARRRALQRQSRLAKFIIG